MSLGVRDRAVLHTAAHAALHMADRLVWQAGASPGVALIGSRLPAGRQLRRGHVPVRPVLHAEARHGAARGCAGVAAQWLAGSVCLRDREPDAAGVWDSSGARFVLRMSTLARHGRATVVLAAYRTQNMIAAIMTLLTMTLITPLCAMRS